MLETFLIQGGDTFLCVATNQIYSLPEISKLKIQHISRNCPCH